MTIAPFFSVFFPLSFPLALLSLVLTFFPVRPFASAGPCIGSSTSPASVYPTGRSFASGQFPSQPPVAAPALSMFSPLEALAFAPASVSGQALALLLAGLVASLVLVGILSLVARLQPEGATFTPAFERLTSYECGFAPFGKLDQPQLFLFYKLAVFFVIFEAELIFLYPWALALVEASAGGLFFLAATPFLAVLYLGFFYEIDREALDF